MTDRQMKSGFTPESRFCLNEANREFIELMAKAFYKADKKEHDGENKPE